MSYQSSVTASILQPYNITIPPIYYVPTINDTASIILPTNYVTALILRPYNLIFQPYITSLINNYCRPRGPLNILSQLWYPNTLNQPITKNYRPHGLTIMIPKNNSCLSPASRLTPVAAQATADAHGCASSGAAGGTQRPSSSPRLCYVLLSYCVLCFAMFVIRYPRTKTHKPRGRASDVSMISTCFFFVLFSLCHDLLPTPPPISVRKAGGITVVYLCGF